MLMYGLKLNEEMAWKIIMLMNISVLEPACYKQTKVRERERE